MTFSLEFLKDANHAFRYIFISSDMSVYFKMSVSRNVTLHIQSKNSRKIQVLFLLLSHLHFDLS